MSRRNAVVEKQSLFRQFYRSGDQRFQKMISLAQVPTRTAFGGPTTKGSSAAAHSIADLANKGLEHYFQPWSRSQRRQAVLQHLASVAEECSQPGWDGHQAKAVAEETYRQAYFFVEGFPPEMPLPTVGAEPDGHLTLEWHRNPRRTLSVSVSPSGELHYSALIGHSSAYGTECFLGEVPPTVLDLTRRIYLT
ncbi:MAG: hypothetical protein ACREFX_08985 [Opitutaceae bacterium]